MSAGVRRLLWARGLRAFADGYVSLLLPVYLIGLGLTPFKVGMIATATLLGSGTLTLLVGFRANRFDSRVLLETGTGSYLPTYVTILLGQRISTFLATTLALSNQLPLLQYTSPTYC